MRLCVSQYALYNSGSTPYARLDIYGRHGAISAACAAFHA
jgi:hypothetical protein